MRQNRGEAQCPHCGSTNLTYKHVFDYYKCNDCRITFITPVFSYGYGDGAGLDSAKDVASRIFGGERTSPSRTGNRQREIPGQNNPFTEEEPRYQQMPNQQIPEQPASFRQPFTKQIPVQQAPQRQMSVNSRPPKQRPMRAVNSGGQSRGSLLVPVLLMIIIILVLVIIWLLFGEHLAALFSGLS